MRIIHCADLHLDSKMSSLNDKDKAKERKDELLSTFVNMVSFAEDNGVGAIIIAGDLFDTNNILARTRNQIINSISCHRKINFYYLRGNHDENAIIADLDVIPENLKLFNDSWKTYEEAEGRICLSGLELTNTNSSGSAVSLVCDSSKFNIVVLHGQESVASLKDKTEVINIREYKNKGIDYLALGHIHAYKREQLDPRGVYCYSGCLEGRGFDECGSHGFVLLDIDELTGHFTDSFVPFAKRNLYTAEVDVSGCQTTAEMITCGQALLNKMNYAPSSLLKIVLKGAVDVECEKDINYLLSRFKEDYYYVKVYDETSFKINIEEYMLDASLKGEFVRKVYEDKSLSEDEKKLVVRYGLKALQGEEVQ